MSRELDSEEKIMEVARQLRLAEMGISKIFQCPYCQGSVDFTPTPEKDAAQGANIVFCCEKFGFALAAVCAREETNDMIDFAHRLEDKAEGQAVFN